MNLFQRECARKNYQAIPINDKNDADKYFLFALVDKNSNGDIFSISDKAGIAREFLLSTGSSLSIDIAGDKKINVLINGQLLRTIDFSYEKDGVNIDFCYLTKFTMMKISSFTGLCKTKTFTEQFLKVLYGG